MGWMRGERPDSDAVRVVLVTVPSVEEGRKLARAMVEGHVAACGNVVPGLVSIYRWEGDVQEDEEALVLFKTTQDRLTALRERVLELHPYEVPEILALDVTDGHLPYLEWVIRETRDDDSL
jgi:periplasmic divalent cation tolerance protein